MPACVHAFMLLPPRILARIQPFHHPRIITATLIFSPALTFGASKLAYDAVHREAQRQLEFLVARMRDAIFRGRMLDYEQVLRTGVELFKPAPAVGRADWQAQGGAGTRQ